MAAPYFTPAERAECFGPWAERDSRQALPIQRRPLVRPDPRANWSTLQAQRQHFDGLAHRLGR